MPNEYIINLQNEKSQTKQMRKQLCQLPVCWLDKDISIQGAKTLIAGLKGVPSQTLNYPQSEMRHKTNLQMSDKLLANLSSIPNAPGTIQKHIRAYRNTLNPELIEQAFSLFKLRFKGLYTHPLPIISTLKLMNEFFLFGSEKVMLQVVEICLEHVTEFACLFVPLEEYQYQHKIDDFLTPESFITFSSQLKKYEISLVTLCKEIIQVWHTCASKHSSALSAVKQAYKRVPSLVHKKWMYCSQDMPRLFHQNIKAFPQQISELVKSEMEYLVYARSICRQAKSINLGPKNISQLNKIIQEVEDINRHSKQYIKRLQESIFYDKQALLKAFNTQLQFASFFLQIHKLLPHQTATFKKRLSLYFEGENAEVVKTVTIQCKSKEKQKIVKQKDKEQDKSIQKEKQINKNIENKPEGLKKQQITHYQPMFKKQFTIPKPQHTQQQSIMLEQSILKKNKKNFRQPAISISNQIEHPNSTPVEYLKQKQKQSVPSQQSYDGASPTNMPDQLKKSKLLKKRAFESFVSFDSHLSILQKFQQEQHMISNSNVSVLHQRGYNHLNKPKKQSIPLEQPEPNQMQHNKLSTKGLKKQQISFYKSIFTTQPVVTYQEIPQTKAKEIIKVNANSTPHPAPQEIPITKMKARVKANVIANATSNATSNLAVNKAVQKVTKMQQISNRQLNKDSDSDSSQEMLIEPQYTPKSKSKRLAVKHKQQRQRHLSNVAAATNTVHPKKAARKILQFSIITIQAAVLPTSHSRASLYNNIAYMITLQTVKKNNTGSATDMQVFKQTASQCTPPLVYQRSLQTQIVPHSIKIQTQIIKERIQGCQTSLTGNQLKKRQDSILTQACVIKSLELQVSQLTYKLTAVKIDNQKLQAQLLQAQTELQQLGTTKAILQQKAQLANRRSSQHECRIEQLQKHKDELMRSERAFRSQMDFRRGKFKSRQKSLIFFNAAVNN